LRLEILIPSRVLIREEISALVAEGREGSFGVLPRHVDYVSPLVPGILTYRRQVDEEERIWAVDQGILIKIGSHVTVSVRDAVPGEDLETLRALVSHRFRTLSEKESQARAALTTLEARFMRRFVEQLAELRTE
jgi:F-type H+-transporting ATPase subunit epsilon